MNGMDDIETPRRQLEEIAEEREQLEARALKRRKPELFEVPEAQAAPISAPHPRELSDAEQLKTVMDQINALTGGGGTNQGQVTASPTEAPPTPGAAEPTTPKPPPAAPAKPPVVVIAAPAAFKAYDVVQVSNPQSRYYGILFQVGDCQNGQVHGYAITEGGGREFFTLGIMEVRWIGESKIRARVPCSSKWLAQHRVTR